MDVRFWLNRGAFVSCDDRDRIVDCRDCGHPECPEATGSPTGFSGDDFGRWMGEADGSGRLPFVRVMQPADLRDRDDAAVTRRVDPAGDRCVFVQRQVRAGLFVTRHRDS